MQSRVRELQAVQAEASRITAERLLGELEEARNLALSLGQAGAAVAASMGRAKLCGLLVDRREDVTRRPTRSGRAGRSCGRSASGRLSGPMRRYEVSKTCCFWLRLVSAGSRGGASQRPSHTLNDAN